MTFVQKKGDFIVDFHSLCDFIVCPAQYSANLAKVRKFRLLVTNIAENELKFLKQQELKLKFEKNFSLFR